MTRTFIAILLFAGLLSPLLAAQQCNYSSPGYVVNRFADLPDGSVQDTLTGLVWQRCNLGRSWDSDLKVCASEITTVERSWKDTLLALSLFNEEEVTASRPGDWRLPNIKELSSIVNQHCSDPAAFTDHFLDSAHTYWSATPVAAPLVITDSTTGDFQLIPRTWVVDFRDGIPHPANNGIEQTGDISGLFRARLVRDLREGEE